MVTVVGGIQASNIYSDNSGVFIRGGGRGDFAPKLSGTPIARTLFLAIKFFYFEKGAKRMQNGMRKGSEHI